VGRNQVPGMGKGEVEQNNSSIGCSPFPWLAMIRETGGVVKCSLRRALPRAHLTTPPVSRKIAEIRERGRGE
jgi:hypothetical protein